MLVSLKNSLIAFVAVTLISCNNHHHQHSIKGNGNVITEKRNISENFTHIEVGSAIEVIIEQADRTKVLVEADENLQNSIITDVKNGVLIISRKNGNYNSQHGQKVYITAPIIEELTANSASFIKTKNTLKGENIGLNTSSAAKIEAQLSIDNIKVNSSSASKIEIKGMALNLETEATSASNINAEDLLANNITAESSSGSKISIHPIVSLTAEASSGGKIEYHNNPKHIEKSTSSGGNISKE
ncbi:head GIN domain-containing protein [Flavobacterium flavipallidum]|uniref:Head GIN domain-containing protein n=1 Tax=Flavobacterium flavipallidum TaxID=3139140 RepID=A0ABU9HQM1_9FLAO